LSCYCFAFGGCFGLVFELLELMWPWISQRHLTLNPDQILVVLVFVVHVVGQYLALPNFVVVVVVVVELCLQGVVANFLDSMRSLDGSSILD
ncbi:hypothetical protein, partial [Alteromonas stellipolaris]|uniref:hypothetical protein n=1 Tax=Alteromonas stellipolaris TaxID=233316 RepID=UPI001D451D24